MLQIVSSSRSRRTEMQRSAASAERWSIGRSLVVLVAVSILAWAVLAGLAVYLFG